MFIYFYNSFGPLGFLSVQEGPHTLRCVAPGASISGGREHRAPGATPCVAAGAISGPVGGHWAHSRWKTVLPLLPPSCSWLRRACARKNRPKAEGPFKKALPRAQEHRGESILQSCRPPTLVPSAVPQREEVLGVAGGAT